MRADRGHHASLSSSASAAIDLAGERVHLVGIGGCGMVGVARLLLDVGAGVSGSDRDHFDDLGELCRRGACVYVGHDERNVHPETTLVVYSSAVPLDNPELAEAARRGLRRLSYPEMLGAIMDVRDGVAVAGTHGKSTTTAMTAFLFRAAGLDPSFVVGGRCDQLGGSSGVGSGRHFIVESCEFNRSFLHLRPHSAAVLNVETDHLDYYRDLSDITDAFAEFCGKVRPGGLVVCNGSDALAMRAARAAEGRVQTFGLAEGVDWRATHLTVDKGRCGFDVEFRGRRMLSTRLAIPGTYNVCNALAAIALAFEAGADPDVLALALPEFGGVSRRMTLRGQGRGVTILDDYAHHPTEIRVTIEAARFRYTPKRTVVVFQPHQYSRTQHFLDDFARAFRQADEVIVPNIYHSREAKSDYGVTGSQELASRITEQGVPACYLPSFEAVTEHVMDHVAEGDLVMTMGAGDVWKVADGLVERICRSN